MFIELTDHLRCTADHPEQYLVLLPGLMQERRVVGGELGCPACGRIVRVEEGIADFGGGTASVEATALTEEAVAAFLGLSGPGGYVALGGSATLLAKPLTQLLPGVRLVLVNPPAGVPDGPEGSVLRAGRLPLKRASMRGVVLGADLAREPAWILDAARAALPGLRIVVESASEPPDDVEVLARSPEVWVGNGTART